MSILTIVARQKNEWEALRGRPLIPRNAFAYAQRQLGSEQVKVIVGPRRAGKSAFAAMLLAGKNAAYLNFDEAELSGASHDEVLAELYAAYPNSEYVFFDEIQNVPKWPLLLNRLQRERKNVIVTGSNANLLSGELMTHLTGRHVAIEILPFSFSEYIRAKGISPASVNALPLPEQTARMLELADEMLQHGGYPETVVSASLDAASYLSSIWSSIIYNDVVSRYSVRRPQAVSDVGGWVLANAGVPVSYRGLASDVRLRSSITAEKYLRWLEEAYLVKHITRYANGAGTRNRSDKRFYSIDNGLITSIATRVTASHGRLLENAVMNELLKAGYQPERQLFYYKSNDGRSEVDFLLRKDSLHVSELVQVCWDISETATLERELRGVTTAKSSLHKQEVEMLIITRNEERAIETPVGNVRIVPFWKWAATLEHRVQSSR